MNNAFAIARRRRGGPRRRERGFSLIELMVAVTIGLVIIASLVAVLSVNSGDSRTNDQTAELVSNGRYALNSMKQEIRQAGFRGYTTAQPSAPGALTGLTGECLQGAAAAGTFVSNIRQGIWGSDNTNVFSGNCIPSANYAAGNDVLVVRRLADTPSTTLVANRIYFYSTYSAGQIFQGTTTPTILGSPAPAPVSFEVREYVYYISPYTVSAAENPKIPALWRVALGGNGAMAPELVASGIERMQVQYGLASTTAPTTTQYVDTMAGASWAPLTAGTPNATWDSVVSVQIWLLARNSTIEPGYSNTNIYSMGNAADYQPNDGYRRQLFTTVVQLRN